MIVNVYKLFVNNEFKDVVNIPTYKSFVNESAENIIRERLPSVKLEDDVLLLFSHMFICNDWKNVSV